MEHECPNPDTKPKLKCCAKFWPPPDDYPLVLVRLGLGVGKGLRLGVELGLGNQVATSTRGGNNLAN